MNVDNITYDQLDIAKDGDSANKIDLNDITELLKDSNGINILQNAFDSSNETITSKLSEIKKSLINSLDFSNLDFSNGSSDIFAIQIIGHIVNPSITIDGFYGKQSKEVLNNKNIFGDNVVGNIEKNESIEKNTDFNQILDKTINEVINSYLKDLNSKEGINLSTEGIYNNVVEIIDNLGNDINKNSLYKEDFQTVKNNFLLPKEKGLELIDFVLKEKVLNKNRDNIEIDKDNIDGYFNVLESSLGTLFDMGANKSETELRLYFDKMKEIEGVDKIFKQYPDLEKTLFNIVPGVIKTIPKEQFMGSLQVFLEGIKGDILTFNDYVVKGVDTSTKSLNKSKISVINHLSIFFLSVLNKDGIDSFSDNIVNLDLIKNNELLNELFELVNYEGLNSDDRYTLVTKLLEGVNLFSLPDISDIDLNDYINTLTGTLSNISSKLPKDKILSLVNKMKGNTDSESPIIENGDINYTKLASFLWENKSKITSVMGERINSDSENFKEFIIEVFQNNTLTESLNGLGGQIVEKLRDIAGIDLKNILLNIRKDFLKYDITLESSEIEKKENNLSKIENDLIGLISNKLEKNISDLVLNKISSKNDNNLRKEEIIKMGITNIKEVINENPEIVFTYLKELGYIFESFEDKKNILNIVNDILENPKFESIVGDIISNIGKNLEDKKDIRGELDKLLKDTVLSSATNLLTDGIKNNIQELTIETAYDEILGDKGNLKTVFNVLKTNLGLNIEIPDDKLFDAGNVIKSHLSEDNFIKLVSGTDFIKLDMVDLGQRLYSGINDKVLFVNEIIDLGVIDAASKIKIDGVRNTNEGISIENTKVTVDLLYTTLNDYNNDSKDSNVSDLLNKILNKQGLSELINLEIMGKNIGENIVAFLNSINKEKLKTILVNNNNTINDLLGTQTDGDKTSSISKISTDLLNGVDIDKFKDKYKDEDLNDIEKIQLDLADEVQELTRNKSTKIEGLASQGTDIYDMYNGEIELTETKENEIKQYGEEVFDMINIFINKIDDKYLENNLKMPEGNGEKDSVVGSLISSFASENKWFIVKEGIKGVFTGFSGGKTIDNYFRNSKSNRSNFGDTLKDFVIDNNKLNRNEK